MNRAHDGPERDDGAVAAAVSIYSGVEDEMPIHQRHRARNILFTSIGASVLTLAAIACTDDTVDPPPAAPGGDAGGDVVTDDVATPTDAPASDANDSGGSITVTRVVSFDAAQYELPEALSYKDGFAYVSLAPKAQIVKIAIPGGARSVYATLPLEASNLVLGSTFDTMGNLFVGVGASNPADAAGVAAAGVYKIAPGAGGAGGTPALFASAAAGLKFGNGLGFDAAGNLFVTDAAEGAVYKIAAQGAVGTATPWKLDPTLTGDMNACPGTVAGFPIGANGIFVDANAVWVGNTDRGALAKIAVNPDGSAGTAANVVVDCTNLEGLDGFRPDPRDPTNAFLGVNNPKNRLVRITRTGVVTIVHQASPPDLDGPADLVRIGATATPTELLVVNSAFPEAFAPPDAGLVPRPSLVKITLR
jgi:hypothetical protein